MARDYKHRANPRKQRRPVARVAWWKWVGVIVLIAVFVYFLNFLSNLKPEVVQKQETKSLSVAKTPKKKKQAPKHQDKIPKEPEFNFYTILTEEEIVVPDYEINTRSREEKFGKLKKTKYLMQAGSFRDEKEADKLKASLALLGIESRIEKASVGDAVWNRVRLGPYKSPSDVAEIKKRLKDNGIDAKVTELKE